MVHDFNSPVLADGPKQLIGISLTDNPSVAHKIMGLLTQHIRLLATAFYADQRRQTRRMPAWGQHRCANRITTIGTLLQTPMPLLFGANLLIIKLLK